MMYGNYKGCFGALRSAIIMRKDSKIMGSHTSRSAEMAFHSTPLVKKEAIKNENPKPVETNSGLKQLLLIQ